MHRANLRNSLIFSLFISEVRPFGFFRDIGISKNSIWLGWCILRYPKLWKAYIYFISRGIFAAWTCASKASLWATFSQFFQSPASPKSRRKKLSIIQVTYSFPKSLSDLEKIISIERIKYFNIFYMTRDLTDQKGWVSSNAIQWWGLDINACPVPIETIYGQVNIASTCLTGQMIFNAL